MLSLYFDGRKVKTITMAENRRPTVTEEHIVLISEPGAKCVVHVQFQNQIRCKYFEGVRNIPDVIINVRIEPFKYLSVARTIISVTHVIPVKLYYS